MMLILKYYNIIYILAKLKYLDITYIMISRDLYTPICNTITTISTVTYSIHYYLYI